MALLKNTNHFWANASGIEAQTKLKLSRAFKSLKLDNRVKGSTLMETLVATVLIVIVFMVASMILNNILSSNIRQNTELAEERLHVLEYKYKNDALELPYYEDYESWNISIIREKSRNKTLVFLEAENVNTKKVVSNYIVDE